MQVRTSDGKIVAAEQYGGDHIIGGVRDHGTGSPHLIVAGEMVPLRDAHARYYLGLAEAALSGLRGPEQDAWLISLEQEQDNLRTAQRWVAEGGDPDAALRLGLTAILGGGRKPRAGLPDAPDRAGT